MWTLRSDGTGDMPALTFRVTPGAARTLGRAAQADFVVDATLVSRLHCRFSAGAAGELEVEDLGSTNGTWVNGQRVERAPLAPGDRVRVGELVLLVEGAVRP
ncbi:MAG: transporter ATP-binding/permease protein [Acidobacteria bacterium]|nr:transporter ATP-binding/permease protein [Acidobacteriota bacterium]